MRLRAGSRRAAAPHRPGPRSATAKKGPAAAERPRSRRGQRLSVRPRERFASAGHRALRTEARHRRRSGLAQMPESQLDSAPAMTRDISQHPQHRNHCPHRLGQDDADRAHPLLHQADPHDPRGAGQGRRRRDDGLHGARARARHHHPSAATYCDWDDHHINIIDTPGPRRLHHRGRARAARARRRDPGALRRGRRAVAVDDRRPPDAALQGSAPRLHQQARPLRRQPLPGDRAAAREARPQRRADADPDRPRGRPRRACRPGHDEGHLLRRRQRRERSARTRSPPTLLRRGRGRARDDARRGLDVLRRADRGDPRGARHRGADPRRPCARARSRCELTPGLPGLRLQEQGRAAAARRGDRATCRLRPTSRTRRVDLSNDEAPIVLASRSAASRSSRWPSSSRTAATASSPTCASTRARSRKGGTIVNSRTKQAATRWAAWCACTRTRWRTSTTPCAGDIVALFGIDCASGDTFTDGSVDVAMTLDARARRR